MNGSGDDQVGEAVSGGTLGTAVPKSHQSPAHQGEKAVEREEEAEETY